jgi:phage terminase large subunit GpA-like protein
VSEFAERERWLSPENAAASGRWKDVPYQTAMQNVFNESGKKIAIFMTSSQVGKTEIIKNMIAYAINLGGGTTFMLPSESIARDFSKAQIGPLIRDTPLLAAQIPESKKDGNTHLFKSWPGGYLRLVGSQKADKLSSFPSPRLFIDELDRCSRVTRNSAGVIEGSPVDLFLERCKNWPNRFALFTSTPTGEGVSAIEEWWHKSDQRLPYIPCPHCQALQFLAWDQFEWVGKDNPDVTARPETVCFRCKGCHETFTDNSRLRWLKQVQWVKQKPESLIAGFHLNAFYSPWSSWESLLRKYLDCGSNQLKKMVWVNTTLGKPFSLDAIKTPDWKVLAARKTTYARYEIPEPVKILLAGCDVQFDRLEVSVYGVYKAQLFIITHEVLVGNTANVDDEVWGELDQLLARPWLKKSGYELHIHRLAIDAHYHTTTVAHYARRRKQVVPVTGIDNNWKTDLLPSRPMDIKRNGQYFRTGKRRWPVGVSVLKMDLYNRLKLEATPDAVPREYIHFPSGMPDEFYKQITGETCRLVDDSKGNAKMVWEKIHDAVECLDCAVYTLALYKICGLHLWSEERWEKIASLI